jgi:hypothetical protein
LSPADKEGFITKQGVKIKTWKRRWMVMKGNILYYFKGKKVPGQLGQSIFSLRKSQQPKKRQKDIFIKVERGLSFVQMRAVAFGFVLSCLNLFCQYRSFEFSFEKLLCEVHYHCFHRFLIDHIFFETNA